MKRLSAAAAFPVLMLVHCGGGLPLLHPAQTLGRGEVRATTGLTGSLMTGELSTDVRGGSSDSTSAGPSRTDDAYARAVLTVASMAPGIAPLVGARVGLGNQVEGGLAYTARAVRADARRSFGLSPHWALSVGAGGTAVLHGYQADHVLAGLDLDPLHGWGADVPVVLGYASDDDLYEVWLGARGGWEEVDLSQTSSGANAATIPGLSAMRLWGGGLFGVAAGFRHIHVSMEIDVCYANVTGDYGNTHMRVTGLTLGPASSIWWTF